MFKLSQFLQKFSKNLSDRDHYKKEIISIISKHTHLDIQEQRMEIKNYILYIDGSPAYKNKLFTYKQAILEEISKIPGLKVMDMR